MLVGPRTVGCSTRCPAPPREPGALRWPSGRQLVRGQILLTRIIPGKWATPTAVCASARNATSGFPHSPLVLAAVKRRFGVVDCSSCQLSATNPIKPSPERALPARVFHLARALPGSPT